MLSRQNKLILGIIVVILAIAALFVFYKYYRGTLPAVTKPVITAGDLSGSGNQTAMPLVLPNGFSISVFAKDLPGARVIVFDRQGNMWVSQTQNGTISQVIIKDGKVTSQKVILKNLNTPHGLAFDPQNPQVLYFAEVSKISKITIGGNEQPQKIIDLPNGGEHVTRTIGFGPDNRLYVSMGSTCNVCHEQDSRRAAIYSLNKDGSDFKQVASGLRNSVFFVWNQQGQMWATDMGRDYLGDNLPPDELNIIEQDKNYGWPICYSQNIHDSNFDKNLYIRNPCEDKIPPKVEFQAHSAPLGLGFVPNNAGWPDNYKNNLIVAFHGSWNRSVPTGYKLVRVKLDDQGNYTGTEDFISGWFKGSSALGRPVDVIFHNGILYVSDDKAGVVYQITYSH